ncbi:28S ribosomal protein S33, mitochondrial-like [Mya arenaria]|uniref:28S ribosomal protein S33, mitochondrial-like n=1 Tax=Mya arenaria TaxID=6604 RepID=UPI0022E0C686|nr:28S ribosomal protein S33, mitochondrial-like [Mya arenaria]
MASKYAQRMARLSSKIFGEVSRQTDQKSLKIVKIFTGLPPHLDPAKVDYYPRLRDTKTLTDDLRHHGLFIDEFLDFKEELVKKREASGKVKKVPYHIQKRLEKEAKAQESSESS